MPFDNLNVSAQTHLTQHVTRPFRNVTTQHLVAIFCHPHEVVLDVVDRMAPLSYSGMGQPRHRHSGESYSRFRAKAIRLNEVSEAKAKVLDPANGNKQVRNAELPRDFVIVPSAGQGTVILIDPGSPADVRFHVRLIDLNSGNTLVTREIKLPILSATTGYRVVTGDACYKAPFPASYNLAVGQLGRVLYFNNGSTPTLYKDKSPASESITFLKPNDGFTVLEGPHCVINGDQAPYWNFRQWKVKTIAGNQMGWLHEYIGNPEQGFVKYMTSSTTQPETKPEIVTCTVQPADKLDFNGTVTVTWDIRNTTSNLLMLGDTTLTDQTAKGTLTFNVKDIYNYNPLIFSLTAYDDQQNSTDKLITIPVETAGTTINSFTVTPDSVQQGAPVTVTWDIGGPFARAYSHTMPLTIKWALPR